MNAGLAFILVSSIVSIIAYFVPGVRNGKRVFAPFPGAIAFRFKVRGLAGKASPYEKAVLNSFVLLTIIGMILGYWILVNALVPSKGRGAALVPLIPGVTVPLDQMLVLIWVIGFSIAIHEYSHYWACVKQGISVKSAGVGWMLFFPIAFVEPDESELFKKSAIERIRVYAAGPAANMVVAGLSILMLKALATPGIYVIGVEHESPAWKAGIKPGDIIVEVNGVKVNNLVQLRELIRSSTKLVVVLIRGGSVVKTVVDKGNSKLIGIFVLPFRPSNRILSMLGPSLFVALIQFFVWSNTINLGLGVVNALPMFVTDGGKMLMEVRGSLRGMSLALQTFTLLLFLQVLFKSIMAFS